MAAKPSAKNVKVDKGETAAAGQYAMSRFVEYQAMVERTDERR